jgi:hypothetical protein
MSASNKVYCNGIVLVAIGLIGFAGNLILLAMDLPELFYYEGEGGQTFTLYISWHYKHQVAITLLLSILATAHGV